MKTTFKGVYSVNKSEKYSKIEKLIQRLFQNKNMCEFLKFKF